MRRVFVISPLRGTPAQLEEVEKKVPEMAITLAGDTKIARAHLRSALLLKNMDLARRLCREVMTRHGHIAFAPHVYFPIFLDDTIESERNFGINGGREIMIAFEEAWIWTKDGMSEGMIGDVERAKRLGLAIFTPLEWAP